MRFGEPGWRLGYARDAINSYFVFKTLRENGELAGHLRFQVSLPSVNSALPPRIFPDQNDIAKVRPGYQDALAAEIGTIVSKIPPKDLAIQWDCATEVQDAYGAVPGYPAEGGVERSLDQFRKLSPLVPVRRAARLSLLLRHAWRLAAVCPEDLSATVELANATIEASGRRVDWIHIPILDTADDAFFAPLKELRPRGAKVYLGVIHNMARFPARIAAARKVLPDSGWRAIAASAAFRRATCLPC